MTSSNASTTSPGPAYRTLDRILHGRGLLTILLVPFLSGAVFAQDSGRDNARREIVNKLSTQRISVDFRAVSLQEAIDFIRAFSGINIVVDASIHTEFSEDDLTITMRVRDLLLKSVLKLMSGPAWSRDPVRALGNWAKSDGRKLAPNLPSVKDPEDSSAARDQGGSPDRAAR